MSKRFVALAIVLGLILLAAGTSLRSETSTVLEVFFWLLLMLVVSGVALWPSTGRDQQAELLLERRSWADRIDFTPAPSGSPPPPRSEPPQPRASRTA